jgi:hypothetical protein
MRLGILVGVNQSLKLLFLTCVFLNMYGLGHLCGKVCLSFYFPICLWAGDISALLIKSMVSARLKQLMFINLQIFKPAIGINLFNTESTLR